MRLLVFMHRHTATSTSCLFLIAEQLNSSSTIVDIELAASIAVAERLVSLATLDAAWPNIRSRLTTRPVHRVNSASSARPATQEPPSFAGTHAHVPCRPNSNLFPSWCGHSCQLRHS